MEKQKLKDACAEIENEIFKINSGIPNIGPISDGVINIDNYLNNEFKILWILKESNDVRNGIGGDWSLNNIINEKFNFSTQPRTGKTVFKRMIYIAYGIFNDFCLYNNIPNISSNKAMDDVIKQIAFINVKKIPGGTSSYEPEIKKAYKRNRSLLLKQINTIEPNIIIGGSTLHHFRKDIKFEELDSYPMIGNRNYYCNNKRIVINAYHPAVWAKHICEEDYCNEIIQAVKFWKENWAAV